MNSNTIMHGDFRKAGKEITDESVDLIFTDPPYIKDGIPLYKDLAILAKRVLKGGGFLITYASDYWLDKTFPIMLNYLDYYYLYHKINTRGNASIFPRRIFAGGKSILVFSKGKSKAVKWTNNVIKINDISKNHRDDNWEQSVEDAVLFISAYCPEEGIVLDPMCGSGTTGVACQNTERNCILIEKEEKYIDVIKERLANNKKRKEHK